MDTEALTAGLTAAQREAVTHDGGALLVVAGAGTGKTSVLTRRIAWLIATKRARPEEILALTFTDKAAAEMAERIDVLVPYGYADVWVSTFHAFADRILRENALRLGLPPDFRVLTRSEQVLVLREHLFDLPFDRLRPLGDPTRFLDALAGVLSRAKDEDIGPEAYASCAAEMTAAAADAPGDEALAARAAEHTEIAALYAAYARLTAERGLIDFGDQIVLLLRLLRENAAVREELQRRFRYVLVDEFQDTNHAQFAVLELLAGAEGQLTVVADDDQAIYTFRGAESRNILAFLERWPDAHTLVLTDNFRSRQEVLDHARRLIVHNDPDRLEARRGIDKRLVARAAAHPLRERFTPAVIWSQSATVWEEADGVAAHIAALHEAGVRWSDAAILVRANSDAEPFLRALNMREIPWRFSGNAGLFARPEIATVRYVLRVVADPRDAQSLYALAAGEPYAVAPELLGRVLADAERTHRPFEALLRECAAEDATVARLCADLDRLRALAATRPTGEVLYDFLTASGWLARLVRRERPGDEDAVQNLARFFEHVRRFAHVADVDRVAFFDRHLRAQMEAGDDPPVAEADRDVDAVHVLTVHRAKGLEFVAVFMVGLVQGRFPARARRDPLELPPALVRAGAPGPDAHVAEERRLFYVAMTRAKEWLVLSSAEDIGGRRVRKPSQFIFEALDRAPQPTRRDTAPETAIERHARAAVAPALTPPPPAAADTLTLAQIDDYLTCPQRYRYVHELRVPVMRHHAVAYGHAVREAVRACLAARVGGGALDRAQAQAVLRGAWTSEGFLTREHEDLRFAEAEATLDRFLDAEASHPSHPSSVARPFSARVGGVRLIGSWTRVDEKSDGAVELHEYSSGASRDAADAARRTREHRRLALGAVAWRETTGAAPARLVLHLLGSGTTGEAEAGDERLRKAEAEVERTAAGIAAGAFAATPSDMVCRRCAFVAICPQSASTGGA